MDLSVAYNNFRMQMTVLYRPPPARKNNLSAATFYQEFSELLSGISYNIQPLIIAGDFNFHLDDSTNLNAIKFIDLLDSTGLVQNVKGATHNKGHTLDLVITRQGENIINNLKILPDIYSDHRIIMCHLDCPKPPLSKVLITYRSTKHLDPQKLCSTISTSLSANKDLGSKNTDVNVLMDTYNSSLKAIYDVVAPVQTTWVNHCPWAPWYNDELRTAKQEKRRLERKYRKTQLTIDKQLYWESCDTYNKSLEAHKTKYYREKIEQADKTKLLKIVHGLFHKTKDELPSHTTLKVLAEDFNKPFRNKILLIRNNLHRNKG